MAGRGYWPWDEPLSRPRARDAAASELQRATPGALTPCAIGVGGYRTSPRPRAAPELQFSFAPAPAEPWGVLRDVWPYARALTECGQGSQSGATTASTVFGFPTSQPTLTDGRPAWEDAQEVNSLEVSSMALQGLCKRKRGEEAPLLMSAHPPGGEGDALLERYEEESSYLVGQQEAEFPEAREWGGEAQEGASKAARDQGLTRLSAQVGAVTVEEQLMVETEGEGVCYGEWTRTASLYLPPEGGSRPAHDAHAPYHADMYPLPRPHQPEE